MRIHVITGHSKFVYQERVDYLARSTAWAGVRTTPTALPFDAWLAEGLPQFDEAGDDVRWYAPFCAPSLAR